MSGQFRPNFIFQLLEEALTNPFPAITMKSITGKDRWMVQMAL